MNGTTQPTPQPPRFQLAPLDWPGRAAPKPLGLSNGELIGLSVEAARYHVHVPGVTGTGKSTWQANAAVAEAEAGRGLVLIDCQGDLANNVLDRLPAHAGHRLVILDPAERAAPPAWNVLAPPGPLAQEDSPAGIEAREFAAETVIGTFRKVYAQWWGPRMDEIFRAACLTLARRPGSTLADVIPILTRPGYHQAITSQYGEPGGFEGFWDGYTAQSPAQRQQLYGPVVSRLRAVLSRRFVRDLLAAPASTIDLTQILDGGILIARIPKGELGDHGAQLVGSLLLSGLWSAITRRAIIAPAERPDATIIVDECHNFLHLPIGVDDALAEARGYRVSFVLAHQHLKQLPDNIRGAVDANARNKLVFTISPEDADKLARHFGPFFTSADIAGRPGYSLTVRILHDGHNVAPFSLDTLPLPPPVTGRAQALRAAARELTGLPQTARDALGKRRTVSAKGSGTLADGSRRAGFSPSHSVPRSPAHSPSDMRQGSEWDTPNTGLPQVGGGEQ